MKEIKLETKITVYSLNEVPDEELPLVHAALKATEQSYAPYSKFHVGAAALLADGTIVTGSNQENAAYPSGLCAERNKGCDGCSECGIAFTALFWERRFEIGII